MGVSSQSLERFDLNALVTNPGTTYYLRASSDGAQVHKGDLVIVDRSRQPRPGDVVVTHHRGKFTIKARYRPATLKLVALAGAICADPSDCWGVVTHIIRSL